MSDNYVVPSLEQLTVLAALLNKCDIFVNKMGDDNWGQYSSSNWSGLDLLSFERMSEGILLDNGLDIVFYDRQTGSIWEEGCSLGIVRKILEEKIKDITYMCLLNTSEDAAKKLRSMLAHMVNKERFRLERAVSTLQLRDDIIDGELGDEKLLDLSQPDEE